MRALLSILAILIFAVWAVGFLVFKSSDSIHLLLLIDFLILLKALKPEREEKITRYTSDRNYIK